VENVIPFSWRIFALFSNFFFGIKRFQGNVYFYGKKIKIVNLPFLTYTVTLSVTIQMKAVKKYFPVVLFIMLYKMFLSFESVAEILTYDHSNESSIF